MPVDVLGECTLMARPLVAPQVDVALRGPVPP